MSKRRHYKKQFRKRLLGEVESQKIAKIYTDGSCLGNPGRGAYAGFIDLGETEFFVYDVEENTTNNRMELLAAIRSLEFPNLPHRIILFTDSRYLQQGMTRWMNKWIKTNWKKSTGDDVKNNDLWKRLNDLNKQFDIKWVWVKGHASNLGNSIVDGLAEYTARKGK